MSDPNIPDCKFLDAFKAFRTDCRRTEVRIITILTFEKRILQVSCNCIIADTNELNHTDHSKKLDGTASDVGDTSTTLNAMSEFPLMWLCQYEVGNYEYIIVSDTRVDESYHADAFMREDGTIADHMYMPMYGGSYDGAKLRSLSGKKLDCNTNAQTEINRAAANGTGWTIISWSRRNLIESLLTLISKSENFQAKFGQGVCSTYVEDSSKDYGKVATGK